MQLEPSVVEEPKVLNETFITSTIAFDLANDEVEESTTLGVYLC